MHPLAVAGQDPLEPIRRQPPHRLGLLRPRIPAVVLGGRKLLRVPVPIQVVAGEEEALLVEQNAVALRVPRRGDGEEIWSQLPRPLPVENDFRTGLRRQLLPMNDAAAAKMLGVAPGIGHVVPVRQEDVGDAAQRLKLLHERRYELGRVDEPVASGVLDEVAVAAIRLRGVVAAVIDRLLDE